MVRIRQDSVKVKAPWLLLESGFGSTIYNSSKAEKGVPEIRMVISMRQRSGVSVRVISELFCCREVSCLSESIHD
jgi:hypothetical protein